MWTPPTIIEDLVAQAKEIYIQGSPLRDFIQEIDEAIWPILLSKPKKAVKLSITLEQIVDLKDVSFHTKLYALMDMAYHKVSRFARSRGDIVRSHVLMCLIASSTWKEPVPSMLICTRYQNSSRHTSRKPIKLLILQN